LGHVWSPLQIAVLLMREESELLCDGLPFE
jgi:hypothetical protein